MSSPQYFGCLLAAVFGLCSAACDSDGNAPHGDAGAAGGSSGGTGTGGTSTGGTGGIGTGGTSTGGTSTGGTGGTSTGGTSTGGTSTGGTSTGGSGTCGSGTGGSGDGGDAAVEDASSDGASDDAATDASRPIDGSSDAAGPDASDAGPLSYTLTVTVREVCGAAGGGVQVAYYDPNGGPYLGSSCVQSLCTWSIPAGYSADVICDQPGWSYGGHHAFIYPDDSNTSCYEYTLPGTAAVTLDCFVISMVGPINVDIGFRQPP